MVCGITMNLHSLLKQIIKKFKTDHGKALNFLEGIFLSLLLKSLELCLENRVNVEYYRVLVGKRGRPIIDLEKNKTNLYQVT